MRAIKHDTTHGLQLVLAIDSNRQMICQGKHQHFVCFSTLFPLRAALLIQNLKSECLAGIDWQTRSLVLARKRWLACRISLFSSGGSIKENKLRRQYSFRL